MHIPYWLDPPSDIAAPLEGDGKCDVVVIGAGITGTAAALHLAREGVDVVLLEADRIASKATGRNAGFILQGTAERYDRAVTLMGHDRARRIHRWSLENHRLMAEDIATESIGCSYRQGGSLQLAGSPQEVEELMASAALLKSDGFQAEILREDQLSDVYTRAGFNMAVLLPQDGELHPANFVRGAACAAIAHGARVHELSPVTDLDAQSAGDVHVQTPHGTLSCEVAIVATNARIRTLLPWFHDKVDPVRGQMLATAPAPRIFERPIYADHGFDYWRQDEFNRIVLGGWRNLDPGNEVGFDDILHPDIQEKMERFIRRFDALKEVEISHRWSGIMGFSKDGLPLIGPVPGSAGALAAAGFTGHGFGFGWLAGHAIAAIALEGEHPILDDLAASRLAT
jgi:gamma-glutamylputrescine oxidase